MSSEVEICNRALQKLGARRISSLTEDNDTARACNTAYEPCRDDELRAHPWSFAITRESLAADSDEPAFGRANAFALPSKCLRLLPPYPEDNEWNLDWLVEGSKIYTDDDAPLEIRYIQQVTDPNLFDSSFRECLAARLAMELCEPITQSNTKWRRTERDYIRALRQARRVNAIEGPSSEPPEDPWITARA